MSEPKQKMSVLNLTQKMLDHMESAGYRAPTIVKSGIVCRMLTEFSESNCEGMYSGEIGKRFLEHVAQRVPPLSKSHYAIYRVVIERINHILADDFDWYPKSRWPQAYEHSCFDEAIFNYENYLYRTEKTKKIHARRCATMDENGLCAAAAYGILGVHGTRPASFCRHERAQKTGIALSDRTTNCSIAYGC